MKLRWLLILVVFLAGCSSKHDYTNPPWNPEVPVKRAMQWMPISEKAGAAWGVDPQLITAIIAIESGGNPAVVSKSGAVGLMQLKPSTSGRDVYRRIVGDDLQGNAFKIHALQGVQAGGGIHNNLGVHKHLSPFRRQRMPQFFLLFESLYQFFKNLSTVFLNYFKSF